MINCPYCGKSHYREGMTTSTCVYYPPVWKDGENVNPDGNTHTTECECLECGKKFLIKNGVACECEQPDTPAVSESETLNSNYEAVGFNYDTCYIDSCPRTFGMPCAICGEITVIDNLEQVFVICGSCREAVMHVRHQLEKKKDKRE